jgi:ATP-dependent 26S proteasome regulatory subunit
MLEVSAASINSMWRRQSKKNVRALFSLARKLAPAVILLDEVDSLFGACHGSRWVVAAFAERLLADVTRPFYDSLGPRGSP